MAAEALKRVIHVEESCPQLLELLLGAMQLQDAFGPILAKQLKVLFKHIKSDLAAHLVDLLQALSYQLPVGWITMDGWSPIK